ncbi:MAG: hypothetical protein Q8N62_00895 [Candidatus Omnitrophota bacterium]|nr:hypothetical protein [Candidatus Omnitrophota bacterium]
MRPILKLFLVVSVFILALTTPSIAQDLIREFKNSATKEVNEGTRIIISTSGPAKFSSYWLESPSRLVVEFQTRKSQ